MTSSKNSGSVFRIDHPVESRLIERMPLENGLTLEMFDNSRPVAGDRWLVCFEARIEVEVKREYLEEEHHAGVLFEDIRRALGETVLYGYESTRNFIDEVKKDQVLKEIMEKFLEASRGYLSSRVFPGKLILKKYRGHGHQHRTP